MRVLNRGGSGLPQIDNQIKRLCGVLGAASDHPGKQQIQQMHMCTVGYGETLMCAQKRCTTLQNIQL